MRFTSILLTVMLMLMAPIHLFAAEAAEVVEAIGVPFEWSSLLPWVWLALGSALSYFVVPRALAWLRASSEAASLAAKNEDLTFKATLVARLKDFLWSKASKLADDNLPRIADKVKKGELADLAAIKAELWTLGHEARAAAVSKFRAEGYDIEGLLGSATVKDLIDRAAGAANIPGRSTSAALQDPEVVEALLAKGMSAFR